MIRVRIAAWLLRTAGASVEFRIKRLTAKGGIDKPNINKDGTTLKRCAKLKEARNKFDSTRVGDNQDVTIQLVANVATRSGPRIMRAKPTPTTTADDAGSDGARAALRSKANGD